MAAPPNQGNPPPQQDGSSGEDSSDEEYYDEEEVMIIDGPNAPQPPANVTPLIPGNFDSFAQAQQNFLAVFESRYGANHPNFFVGELSAAQTEAFHPPGRGIIERRPLALYLHDDRSVAANVFVQNVLNSNQIVPLLNSQFVVWAWDMTHENNRNRFNAFLTALEQQETTVTLHRYPVNTYPMLVILLPSGTRIRPHFIARGSDPLARVQQTLMQGLNTFVEMKNAEVVAENRRIERERLLKEQAEAYERTKAIDLAKKKEAEEKLKRQEELKEEKRRKDEQNAARQVQMQSLLPAEPADGENIINIQVRLPNGETKTRRFLPDQMPFVLVIFVETLGYNMDDYRILTSGSPKKDLTELDNTKNFAQLGWMHREQVFVALKQK